MQSYLCFETGRIWQEALLTWTQGQILDFSFLGALESISRLLFVDLCSVVQAGAAGHVLGPNFCPKSTENRDKLRYIF